MASGTGIGRIDEAVQLWGRKHVYYQGYFKRYEDPNIWVYPLELNYIGGSGRYGCGFKVFYRANGEYSFIHPMEDTDSDDDYMDAEAPDDFGPDVDEDIRHYNDDDNQRGKDLLTELQTLVFDNVDNINNGDYLKMMNILRDLNNMM